MVSRVNSQESACFSVEELAAFLGICINTAYEYLESGTIPGQKLGKKWLISKNAVILWLERKHE